MSDFDGVTHYLGFFYHPSTKSSVSYFRTVPILAEGIAAAFEELLVDIRDKVKAGQPFFTPDSSMQEAAYGDFAGFLIACGYWISIWASLPVIAIAFAGAVRSFPGCTTGPWPWC